MVIQGGIIRWVPAVIGRTHMPADRQLFYGADREEGLQYGKTFLTVAQRKLIFDYPDFFAVPFAGFLILYILEIPSIKIDLTEIVSQGADRKRIGVRGAQTFQRKNSKFSLQEAMDGECMDSEPAFIGFMGTLSRRRGIKIGRRAS